MGGSVLESNGLQTAAPVQILVPSTCECTHQLDLRADLKISVLSKTLWCLVLSYYICLS